MPCKVTTIARGIAFGGELEYADELTLARSLTNRLPVGSYIVQPALITYILCIRRRICLLFHLLKKAELINVKKRLSILSFPLVYIQFYFRDVHSYSPVLCCAFAFKLILNYE